MAFLQRILPGDACQDGHDNCQVIDCITTESVLSHIDGSVQHDAQAVVWHSHMDADVHPEHRLNPCHPAEDHREGTPAQSGTTPWCDTCLAHPAVKGLNVGGESSPAS